MRLKLFKKKADYKLKARVDIVNMDEFNKQLDEYIQALEKVRFLQRKLANFELRTCYSVDSKLTDL